MMGSNSFPAVIPFSEGPLRATPIVAVLEGFAARLRRGLDGLSREF